MAVLHSISGCPIFTHLPKGTDRNDYAKQQRGSIPFAHSWKSKHVSKAVNGRPSNKFRSEMGQQLFVKPENYSGLLDSPLQDKDISDVQNDREDESSEVVRERELKGRKDNSIPYKQSKDAKGNAYKTLGNIGDAPYRIQSGDRKAYLDELDVVALLDSKFPLRPFDQDSYSRPKYLWKKISNVPEERRHQLMDLLLPANIKEMWEIVGDRYEESHPFAINPGEFLLGSKNTQPLEPVVWNGIITGVPWPFGWIANFKKVFFYDHHGNLYGRVIAGGSFLQALTGWLSPLYFEVKSAQRVIATDEPCSFEFEYGEGQLGLSEIPKGFPKPVKHVWPFNDQCVDYIRPVGPGVLVGQWWHEGKDLDQIPRKMLGEFVMFKEQKTR